MSEKEKRDLLEDIKKLPPEKQAYVAGVASGLLMGEKTDADKAKPKTA